MNFVPLINFFWIWHCILCCAQLLIFHFIKKNLKLTEKVLTYINLFSLQDHISFQDCVNYQYAKFDPAAEDQ